MNILDHFKVFTNILKKEERRILGIKDKPAKDSIPLTGQIDGPSLSENEYAILMQLARLRPQLIKISDLAADLNCERSAAGVAVKQLEEYGYADRPKGKRSGIGITTSGLAALRPCDLPSSV